MSAIQEVIGANAPAPMKFAPRAAIGACETYREAVHLAWERRSRVNMTQRQLAEETGLHPPHVSHILNSDPIDRHGHRRMDLPADAIDAFERAVGNHIVRQYLMRLGMLTIMEEVIAERSA